MSPFIEELISRRGRKWVREARRRAHKRSLAKLTEGFVHVPAPAVRADAHGVEPASLLVQWVAPAEGATDSLLALAELLVGDWWRRNGPAPAGALQ